jgi:hypothetical protein
MLTGWSGVEAEMRAARRGLEATEVPVSKRKRPIVLEPDPALYPDPAPLYPDVIALGSLSAAIRAAAVKQGLSIPPKAFRSIGRDSVRPNQLYGHTVHSRIRRREGLRVTAFWRRRKWLIEGGQANHRIEGTALELAEVARVAHAWHDGIALTDIPQLAPCVTLQTVDYRHFGVVRDDDEPAEPSTVLRIWTDAGGLDHEETFTDSLTWEKTDRMSPMARPTYDPDPVEINIATVDWFIHHVTQHIKAERRRR